MKYKRFEELPVWNAATRKRGEPLKQPRQREEFLAELDAIKNTRGAANN